jgi:hypothetical protein
MRMVVFSNGVSVRGPPPQGLEFVRYFLPFKQFSAAFHHVECSGDCMQQKMHAHKTLLISLSCSSKALESSAFLQERTVVKVCGLILVTKIVGAGTPIRLGEFSLQIKDIEGEIVSVAVQLDPSNLDPHQFATDIARRFTPGTTVAMRNMIMVIENDGYFLLLDMEDEDSELICCGDDPLPSLQLAQLAVKCKRLVEMEEYSAALACCLESMDASRDLISGKVAPIMTNLAIAHHKLGYKGVALAYAVGVTRLMTDDTPYKAAVLAAWMLTEMKYEHAPHVLMLKVSSPFSFSVEAYLLATCAQCPCLVAAAMETLHL